MVSLGLLSCLWSTPAFAGKGGRVEVPPKGKAMYTTGLVFTVAGAVQLVGGTVLFASQSGQGFIGGIDALVLGGGFLTLGGLLMHFGEERGFAYRDWEDGRSPPKREHTRRRGAGAILAGTLTLAGGGAAFAFGASSSVVCSGLYASCSGADPAFVIVPLTVGATGVVLGSTLMVVGIHNRSRYLDWRRQDGRVVLHPAFGAGTRGAFIGLRGSF